jgi:hypothetical protein
MRSNYSFIVLSVVLGFFLSSSSIVSSISINNYLWASSDENGGDTGSDGEDTGSDGGEDTGGGGNDQVADNDEGGPPADGDTPIPDEGTGDQNIQCPAGEQLDENANLCVPDPSQQEQIEGLTPLPASNQQTTCPDGSTPDANGNCPTPATAPTQDSHMLVMPNADGTCPEGSHKFPGSQVCEKDTVPNTDGSTGGTTPSQYVPAVNGECPAGSHEAGGSPGNAGEPGTGFVNCRLDNPPATPPATPPTSTPPEQPPTDTLPATPTEQIDPLLRLTQQTCPPLPIDENGRCPGIDMRGGGLGLPPVPPGGGIKEKPVDPDGSCNGAFDPATQKCYEGGHAPDCPGAGPNDLSGGHDIYGFCPDPQTGGYLPAGECAINGGGAHIAEKQKSLCFQEEPNYRAPDGSCLSGYFPTGVNNDRCSLKIHDPLPDGSCPSSYHKVPTPTAPVPGGNMCKLDALKLTNDDLTAELPGGYCPVGYQKRSGFVQSQCFRIT